MKNNDLFVLLESEVTGNMKQAVESLKKGRFQEAVTQSEFENSAMDEQQRELSLAIKATALVALKNFTEAVLIYESFMPLSHISRELKVHILHFYSCALAKLKRADQAWKIHLEVHGLEDQLNWKRDFNQHFYFSQAMVEAGNGALLWNEIKEMTVVYQDLKITEDSFLGVQGLPFFDEFLSVLVKCGAQAQKESELKSVLLNLKNHADDDGQKLIDQIPSIRNTDI